MSKKYLVSIDLNKNELQNAVVQNLATAPSAPVQGQIYYDTTEFRLKYRSSTAWISPQDRATHYGTQAWNTITATPTTLSGYGITDAQPLSANLTAFSGLNTNGFVARTGTGTAAVRSLASGTAAATWANADGSSGNPTLSIASVTTSVDGLMIAADKVKLNGIAAGATANATDAQLRDRSTHTGTQAAATISDFDTQVRTNRLDQMATPTAQVNMNGQRVIGIGTPVATTDAATKGYVDALVNGTDWKQSVRVATTANITLSGLLTVDSVTLAAGNRVLVKNQTDGKQNGIYVVASGAWTRATDADESAEVTSGMACMVEEGTANSATQWILNTAGNIVVGTTVLTFSQIGAATTYTAGAGINIAGNVVSIDTSVVTRKGVAFVGNGSSTSITVTHNLGTLDVMVQVYAVATTETVECDVTRNSTNQVTLGFAVAPANNSLKVLIQG